MPLSAGSTFLLPIRVEWVDHLWILLTSVDSNGKILMVNLTSAKPHSDRTTVLQVGDHPFVTRETTVNYGNATIAEMRHIMRAIDANLGEKREDASTDLLKRLREVFLTSPYTKNSLKDYLREQLAK